MCDCIVTQCILPVEQSHHGSIIKCAYQCCYETVNLLTAPAGFVHNFQQFEGEQGEMNPAILV